MPTENRSNTVLAPRPGKEFWDKLTALPRYMFLLKASGSGVQKLEDFTGNWIDVHEAQQVVDQAQEEINQLRGERDALQLRLNAADQRIDELVELLTEAQCSVDYHAGMKHEGENENLYNLLERIKAALKPVVNTRDLVSMEIAGI